VQARALAAADDQIESRLATIECGRFGQMERDRDCKF
jgi:hypothetical protein